MADKKHKIVVTPEVLRQLAKDVKNLTPALTPAKDQLNKVAVKAGRFPDGTAMENTVAIGADARAKAYVTALNGLDTALTTLAERLTTIADNYANVDDINKITATDINDMVSVVTPKIGPAVGG
ncbi:type VII secretion target [Frankia sp. CiP3]|uniref:type VII secretion target n=1 Tax=Frankia sp. CiP3 TaxID=2880971 RepID=UPI001EF4D8FE|nr:type VII secretion target [Frankia sp. CiP3]